MGKDCVRPDRQDGREPAAVRGQRSVTGGIDAAMNDLEPADCQSAPNRADPDAEIEQLPPGNDPVLPSRETGDLLVGAWGARRFGSYTTPFA
jgi:hypothetical protein